MSQNLQDSQSPVIRRAYVVRASSQLLARLAEVGEADLAESLSVPTVVMTEPLRYEGKLEGYRSLILGKCKTGFITDLHDLLGDQFTNLFGDLPAVAVFDNWWLAEEADAIEIATDW
ncbi:hypothetical protein [Dyella tabacisoli]|uniref:Uncharacterized protein n=1 Tax=Dyella tabacisoli TaxID=2282381 RepID=A0A369UHJ4_9GAMM|nr:hypothetical protein [Dyella tabacisoli]RDD80041.1 hypothetical protein DVJ77_19405 [Dyella tabacisoli]